MTASMPAKNNLTMFARVLSAALVGAALVHVEVDVSSGLPAFTTVGLPDSAVRESRERVRSAIRNAGFAFPSDRITVNLAPADLRKEGARFYLPTALGILSATGLVKLDAIGPSAVIDELALDSQIHAVRGTFAVGLACRPKEHPDDPRARRQQGGSVTARIHVDEGVLTLDYAAVLTLYAELEDFVLRHHVCGTLTADATEPSERGYLLWILCSCGVRLERHIAADDAVRDLVWSSLIVTTS